MSKGTKYVMVGCGGLLLLCCLAAGGIVTILNRWPVQTPADRVNIAASIVHFDSPSGYAIASARNGPVANEVHLRKSDRSSEFEIVLKSPRLEDPGMEETADELSAPLMSTFAGCEFKPQPDDVVRVRGRMVHFRVYGCSGRVAPRSETGIFGANGHTVIVEAMGDEHFDLEALHALLRSIR